jgi:hypothetical protein
MLSFVILAEATPPTADADEGALRSVDVLLVATVLLVLLLVLLSDDDIGPGIGAAVLRAFLLLVDGLIDDAIVDDDVDIIECDDGDDEMLELLWRSPAELNDDPNDDAADVDITYHL